MKHCRYFSNLLAIVLLAGAWSILPADLHAAGPNEVQEPVIAEQLFASPDEAVKALQMATQNKDQDALQKIFGPQLKELLTGDKVQDAKNAKHFATVMAQGYSLAKQGDDIITIEVGTNNWPMPIPLVRSNGQWYFDTAAGKDEIIDRHIGKDELHAIGVCRAFVAAQQQHTNINLPKSFHGYYFRILKGYALVAYPEHWDHSGIMTFIINQQAQIFQRNFGENTPRIARAMKEYNPDSEWTLVVDEGMIFKSDKKGEQQ
jgi:hypothetical protein